jgi:hypothetical protein
MKGPFLANVLGCKEDEEEEGCMNVVTGEGDAPEGEGRRTSDDSWLQMEENDRDRIPPINRRVLLPPCLS